MKRIIRFLNSYFQPAHLRWSRIILIMFCSVLLFVIGLNTANSQSIPIKDLREEQIQIQQLLRGTQHSSLSHKPIWNMIYESYMKEAENDLGFWSRNHTYKLFGSNSTSRFRLGLYEPYLRFTNNSTVPYGDNNEAAWYGRGLNSEVLGGFWLTSDYLTLSFRPQFVSQQNLDFEAPRFISIDDEGLIIYSAEGLGNIIDAPFRFGPESFNTFSLGYSSIRLHYNSIELGLSTEPLGWGANQIYPLLYSNNAPGMNHFFVGTRAPLNISYLGKLEFKYTGAYPEDSSYFRSDEDEHDLKRFINSINISFSPGFSPNLHFGFARAVHTYLDPDGLKSSDLGLILDPFFLENFISIRGPLEYVKPRNHLNSIYARWLWPESHFELYGEYYREDFAWDFRDLILEPNHNSGYAFGLQKLYFAPYALFYRVNLEFTNMTPSNLQEVRRQDYYYTHPEIIQGHTNQGQILGAAIGPGSNSQYIRIDAYKDWGRYGFFIRRLADNNHFHFNYDRSLNRPETSRRGFGDYWRNRTDLTIGLKGLFEHNDLILSGELSWTKLFNYGRYNYGRFGGLNISNFEPYDLTNIYLQISFTYLF